ncbi:hypothetical protein F511_05226 [Dorcoceras hygrometricum]|uniref:DUF7054 domain-containing protein n=1 Tax=Dorcoceras hygrometricum TaxID=472368 RepID=A0A2Z7CLH0_9LAMI|nr:hypothetical protein F511_05226 [Dorcoceras hygrometricum]
MGSPKNQREGGHKKNKKGRLAEKASSFHGRGGEVVAEMLPRPRTVPELLSGSRIGGNTSDDMVLRGRPARLTKLLCKVAVQRSIGPVQVLIPLEDTVEDLIAAALRQYAKEARRPILSSEASAFDLHYSQFSLESLDRAAKIQDLGSRNFFLCPKTAEAAAASGAPVTTSSSSCSSEADMGGKKVIPWLKFMDFCCKMLD